MSTGWSLQWLRVRNNRDGEKGTFYFISAGLDLVLSVLFTAPWHNDETKPRGKNRARLRTRRTRIDALSRRNDEQKNRHPATGNFFFDYCLSSRSAAAGGKSSADWV